jgi:hypothetical protein
MSIYFGRFLQSKRSRGLKANDKAEESAKDDPLEIQTMSAASPTTRDLTDITMQPAEWCLKYYYLGLLCFALGLGFFTMSLACGTVIWGFMYARLLRERDFRKNLRLHAKIALLFVALCGAYLLMRSYYIEMSPPYIDSTISVGINGREIFSPDSVMAITELPAEFWQSVFKQALPYFEEYYGVFEDYYGVAIVLLALLFVKEIVYRRKGAGVAAMWLCFSMVSIVMPAFGSLSLALRSGGGGNALFFPWYLYFPVAGISIALGLLLRPPPAVEEKAGDFSKLIRASLYALIIAILVALNYGTAKEIRAFVPSLVDENRRSAEDIAKRHWRNWP